jgi:hypothetical protein
MAVGAGEFLHKLEIPKFHNEGYKQYTCGNLL